MDYNILSARICEVSFMIWGMEGVGDFDGRIDYISGV